VSQRPDPRGIERLGRRDAVRRLSILPLLLVVSACASIDTSRFNALAEGFDALHARALDGHSRVQRLQEAVYRIKVSLAPRLDEETLVRPGWLETSGQFRGRDAHFDALREYVADLKALSGMTPTERVNLASRQLFDGSDKASTAAKEVAATVAVLEPRQGTFAELVNRLFPNASLVGAAMAKPVFERARSRDLLAVMRAGRPLVQSRVDALVPTNEVLAEYVMTLKSEYLPDAAQLRDQLTGGDRHRFDQAFLDLLAEFDAVAALVASLSDSLRKFTVAYDDVLRSVGGMSVSGESLRLFIQDARAPRK